MVGAPGRRAAVFQIEIVVPPDQVQSFRKTGSSIGFSVLSFIAEFFSMADPVIALRLFANDSGASCFETLEIARQLRDFAPPAAPLWSSDIAPASGYTVVRLPIGWNGEKHPTPKRFILFGLRGRMRITPDIGEPRIIAAGDVLMMEDTTGAGHFTEVISGAPFDAVMIQLPEISN
jgi:hypothetical protein